MQQHTTQYISVMFKYMHYTICNSNLSVRVWKCKTIQWYVNT